PISKRVSDLLSRMTLEEKVAQLQSGHMGRPKLTDKVLSNPAKMDSLFKNGVGMMNPAFDETLEQTNQRRNALQQYLLSKTRLGIPVIFIDESHHGLVAPSADVFPHSIGFACSWDTALVEKVYNYIAGQAAVRGTTLVLAPVVDVTRDPRWGRTGETFGEDPYLCGMMGSAVVRGFQGSRNGIIAPNHVAATLKHFTGHGQPEGGINQGPADYSVRTLRSFHMEPFRLCIEKANPAAVMASYAEIDGVPSHASSWLLKDVLRKEWKYKGIVVSDWFGIDQLWKKHFIEPNEKAATLRAFNAGVTEDLPYGINYRHLGELVKEGKIKMAALDSAVADILRLKFQLGLFEQGNIDLKKIKTATQDPAGQSLALQAAEESMVLLKNDNNLLPIKPGQYKKIALVGPCAATNYLGDYSGVPVNNVSLLEGLQQKLAGQSEILYAKGCMITKNGDTISQNNYQFKDKTEFPAADENKSLIDEAVRTAQQADLIIVAIGENEQLSREAWLPDHFGDANTLDLSGAQEDLVKAMVATGRPVIVYLAHGRPLSINWTAAHANAIIDGWFTGEQAGNAFANILTGTTCPSGKLTISIPRSVGQIPVYYNHKPSAQFFEYVQGKDTPLYNFGYGLSYTSFRYDNLKLSDTTMPRNGSVTCSVDVTNTGSVKGDEIVQLYIHQKVSSVVRPVKELKGFARISLAAGEKKTVQFTIDAVMLSFWTAEMKYAVEPGVFEVMVGGSLDKLKSRQLTVRE
ncbi:MAG: glycoside hydrolase family 3 C-terminal domain-containing protein, partial [Bacteroidetes bacterium]|nr:glycoside hydrolase family 3 C-terminal domain-containing protein [Bacteroidota bacterium]